MIRTILGNHPITISSPFGLRKHPITGKYKQHAGVDIPCPIGTKVYSPCSGIVRFTKTNSPSAGIYVFIEDLMTGDKYGFMHLSKLLCNKGDVVQAGEEIALSGNTGQSTGPHLHFERSVNPRWDASGYVQRSNETLVDPTDKININYENYY